MIRQLCNLAFKASGWKFVNVAPDDLRSFVFIGAPHTSNHDILPTLAASYLLKRNTKFVIKKEWMDFPFNLLMGPVGAIGLDRSKIAENKTMSTTDAMADLFRKHKDLVLMIAAEGTRKANENWKTGFYYIAQKANVPIALGYVDYPNKEAGIGMVIYPSDFEKDMKTITEFYRTKTGKNEANFLLDKRFR
jgi:1-acyl-sn-glycerol-3-phosphate acyltransferase